MVEAGQWMCEAAAESGQRPLDDVCQGRLRQQRQPADANEPSWKPWGNARRSLSHASPAAGKCGDPSPKAGDLQQVLPAPGDR
jgi:hypothetical protein